MGSPASDSGAHRLGGVGGVLCEGARGVEAQRQGDAAERGHTLLPVPLLRRLAGLSALHFEFYSPPFGRDDSGEVRGTDGRALDPRPAVGADLTRGLSPEGDAHARGGDGDSQGVREITLLGQIVTSFGKRDIPKRDDKSAFVQLIEAVHEIEGLERIRFTSPHPKGYGDDLVEAYGRLPKLVESAHLPVQSGSDRMLKLMHRGYTRERFLEIVRKLRAVRPGIGLTSDVIVGFPGETEDDFEQTLSLCREVEFDNAYLFKYSQRKDTPAAAMPDQLPEELIESRHARLLELVNAVAKRRYDAFVGRQVQILVEGPSKKNEARMMGRTPCGKLVLFDGNERHRGQLMDVRITRAGSSFTLYGDPAIVGL